MNYGEDDTPAFEVEMDAHLMDDREQYYQADPKKALAKFFEREGFDMEFQISEQGSGHSHKWLCTIELPIEINGVDRAYIAQAIVSTSKKDAQVQCALEACRILDAHGVLRGSNSKAKIRKTDMEANDFYDEDDDEYLDRTGQIEKQREKRMMWAKGNKHGDDYHTAKVSTNTGDSLDDYCRQLNQGHGLTADMKNKTDISVLRQKLVALTHDAQRLEKLVKIAKPTALPEIKVAGTTAGANKQAFLRKMMMVGRRKPGDETTANKLKEDEEKAADDAASASVAFKPETEDDDETEDISKVEKAVVHDDATHSEAVTAETVERRSSSPSVPVDANYSSTEELALPGTSKSEEDSAPKVHGAGEDEGGGGSHQLERAKRSFSDEGGTEEHDAPRKKRRARARTSRPIQSSVDDYGNGVDDDRYATWLPPDNQTGDGRTALNRKFEGRY
ncbi:hypothetical protein KIN20_034971 [Parelaphostrongylus tenuis]|uniref:DRBM domain-containing protein n=1 Tax=Parelaphostrongylus tenuis TaxID=148309 RepID=A0AAD5RB04_PARTN|nr:hypothetical protein KIN20_034971 [Parelaphostrongylus tenuis]